MVQGATHIRQDKICQDALLLCENGNASDGQVFSIACVADGHGSDRCPFSDQGAKAAVLVATDILKDLLMNPDPKEMLAAQKDIRLPRQIEARWKETVHKMYLEQEVETPDDMPPFSYELYGSTLLALAAASGFIFALQIGDGDIVAIEPDGLARWLLPPCDHAGNETESLCMDECWKYIRTQLIPIDGESPVPLMFLLSTDGYANSFVESAGFLKVGADIYRMWREHGRDYVQENLPAWLSQTTTDGSGDDIAVAILAKEG